MGNTAERNREQYAGSRLLAYNELYQYPFRELFTCHVFSGSTKREKNRERGSFFFPLHGVDHSFTLCDEVLHGNLSLYWKSMRDRNPAGNLI